jgi:hypothetical protein
LSSTKSPLARYAEHVHATTPASRRVGLIAGYFRITAVASGLGLATTLALAPTHWSSFWAGVLAHPLAFASWPFNIAACWWTAELIGQRQRRGAWVVITSIGLGVLSQLAAHRAGTSATIFAAGLGLAAIASIWRELE